MPGLPYSNTNRALKRAFQCSSDLADSLTPFVLLVFKSHALIFFSPMMLRFTVDSNPRWCCTYLLDASDPLFVEIGKLFIEEQIRGRICWFV